MTLFIGLSVRRVKTSETKTEREKKKEKKKTSDDDIFKEEKYLQNLERICTPR